MGKDYLHRRKKLFKKFSLIDFIKIRNFCSSKQIIKRKKTVLDYKNVSAIHTTDKGFISTIYKELLNSARQQSNKKWAMDFEQILHRDTEMAANEHTKRCLMLLDIMEMQIKQ